MPSTQIIPAGDERKNLQSGSRTSSPSYSLLWDTHYLYQTPKEPGTLAYGWNMKTFFVLSRTTKKQFPFQSYYRQHNGFPFLYS